ncbi:MAG: IS3 family transposase [Lachnospiraceae bacterium]|nr:IS3 family transposase [Lachnospiraceae bacterium]
METSNLKKEVVRKEKYTKKERTRAVKYYCSCKSIAKSIRHLGYPSRPVLKKWVSEKYPNEFTDSKSKRPENPIDNDAKLNAIADYHTGGMSVTMIADKYNVSRTAIYKWVEKINIKEKRAYNDEQTNEGTERIKEMDSLKEEINRLRLERDILEETVKVLKKENGISPDNLTNKEKVIVIDAIRVKYTLKEILKAINMPKSTYMYDKHTEEKPDAYRELRIRIRQTFEESYGTYGYRRIRECVKKENGGKYSPKLIRRLMKEEHLIVRNTDRKYSSYRGEISIAPDNLIDRDFTAKRPNEKWLTDITEFGIPAGKVYLSPLIDCYDGMPVAWSIGISPSYKLVENMLDAALRTLKNNEKPIVHSDRGWHYRDIKWIRKIESAGLTRSMSAKGCSADNAACEGFFGRLKKEVFYGRSWVGVSIEEFINEINSYMCWYATRRIKESLGGLSPIQNRIQRLKC